MKEIKENEDVKEEEEKEEKEDREDKEVKLSSKFLEDLDALLSKYVEKEMPVY